MRVFIVGGTSGIGYSTAKELNRRGHIVFIGVHHKREIEPLKNKLREENLDIGVYKLDVRNKSNHKILEKIEIDCLMIHDGIGNGGSLLEISIDVLRDTYETNIFSNFELLQRFYRTKLERGEKGKIFVTSSIASMLPIPYLGCYTSSKAAISLLCTTLYYELKYINPKVTISVIEPAAYHTGFNQIMIDNKNKYTYHGTKTYKNKNKINRLERNLFRLIEKDSWNGLVKRIIKEMEKEKPKLKVGRPVFQMLFVRLYLLFFR